MYSLVFYESKSRTYLTVTVYKIIDEVYKAIGRPIDTISQLLDNCDEKVWKVYAEGLTTTINQSDSNFGKQTLRRYKPKNLAEMSAWVASIRPGFASLLDNFLDRKPYTTGVKELDEILEDSFHYLLYQESIMKYLVWLGIEEKGTYDIIKKISKKKFKEEELEELKGKLKVGWMKRVGKEEGFEKTWQVVMDAAHYSFNACVAGDTIIQRSSCNAKNFTPTVEEMYLIKNDEEYAKRTNHLSLHRKYKSYGYGNALSMFDDKRIHKNEIVDIRFNSVKDIYRVKTESGAYLDCTLNHKFPTPNGKKKLEELKIGDYLYIKDSYEKHEDNYRFTKGDFVSNCPHKGQKGFQKKDDGNSVLFNKALRKNQNDRTPCQICGKEYNDERFELHHKNMDRTNNSDENLIWLCNSCHKKEHYKLGRNKAYDKGIPTKLDKIETISFLRTDKTYDIEMAEPAHTYISESGLVTSNSHSLSVAIDSLYGAYLKSHYPLEYFTVALNYNSGNQDTTVNLTEELTKFGVKMSDIKFGKSKANYSYDKETNSIFKGIGSIKFINEIIPEQLYNLSKNKYNNFLELLKDIKEQTDCNSKQIDILIRLDFFSEFGKQKLLLKCCEMLDKFKNGNAKQIDKKSVEDDNIMSSIISRNSTHTEKLYKIIDCNAIMKELYSYYKTIYDEDLPVSEKIECQIEYMGYVDIRSDKPEDRLKLIVTDIKPLKAKKTGKVWTYITTCTSLFTGKTKELLINSKIFDKLPLKKYSIINTYPNAYEKSIYNGRENWHLLGYQILSE